MSAGRGVVRPDTRSWFLADCNPTVVDDLITGVKDARGPQEGDVYFATIGLSSGIGATVNAAALNGRDTLRFGDGVWRLDGGVIGDHPANWSVAPAAAELWLLVAKITNGLIVWVQGVVEFGTAGTQFTDDGLLSDFGSDAIHTVSAPELATGYHLIRIQATATAWKCWVDGLLKLNEANTVAWLTSDFPFGFEGSWWQTHGGNPSNGRFDFAEGVLYQRALTDDEANQNTGAMLARWGLGPGGGGSLSDFLFTEDAESYG